MDEIDPSLALGFFIKDKKDFDDFLENVKKLSKMKNSFIQIFDTRPKMDTKTLEDFVLEDEDDDFEKIEKM